VTKTDHFNFVSKLTLIYQNNGPVLPLHNNLQGPTPRITIRLPVCYGRHCLGQSLLLLVLLCSWRRLWKIMPCGLLQIYQSFGRTYYPQHAVYCKCQS